MTPSSRCWTPLFLNAEPGEDRKKRSRDRGAPNGRANLIFGQCLTAEVFLQHRVVMLDRRFNQLLPQRDTPPGKLGGDVLLVELRSELIIVDPCLPLDQVDDSTEGLPVPGWGTGRDVRWLPAGPASFR